MPNASNVTIVHSSFVVMNFAWTITARAVGKITMIWLAMASISLSLDRTNQSRWTKCLSKRRVTLVFLLYRNEQDSKSFTLLFCLLFLINLKNVKNSHLSTLLLLLTKEISFPFFSIRISFLSLFCKNYLIIT